MIDPTTNRNAAATDVYILGDAGPVQTHEPRFTCHGFRFVELTGYPGTVTLDTLAGRSIHADLVSTGTFRSSDPLLDRIHANARQSILNNTMSIPTDNPVRDERGPAAMDVQAYAEAAARNFDVRAFYTGYLENLAGQGLSTSGFFTPAGSPDMNGTPVLLTWLLYEQYGDKGTLVRYYPYLAAYVDSLAQAAPGGIWPDGNGWGDWCPPPPAKLAAGSPVGGYTACLSERPLVNTALYFRAAGLMAGMAAVVGRPADAARYRALADRIETAFNAHFLDAAGDGYGDGRQATSVLPLAFGLVPDERLGAVRKRLISTVSAAGGDHVDTGIFGTRYLLDALQGAGQADASLAVLDQTGYPGFGDQIRLGATTMWEEWPLRTPMETHDHAMFAGIDASLYTGFAGITPLEPGYGRIRIRPSTPTALRSVDAGLDTVRGTVSSRWTETKGHWRLTVHIPVNATAEIDIPLTGDGAPSIHAPSSAERLRAGGTVAVYAVGSGTYTFTRGGTKGVVPAWAVVLAGGSIVGLGLSALRRRRRRAHR
jgi:alpha-L-rhamnosidase